MVLAFAILLLSASHGLGRRTQVDRLKPAAETLATAAADSLTAAEAEIDEMQKNVQNMGEEVAEFKDPTDSVVESGDRADREKIDKRSVFVGNVDFGRNWYNKKELQEHFKSCGQINRITIMRNLQTGRPRGYAFIEFADAKSFKKALQLNGSLFRGRQLTVMQKRTNIPGRNQGGEKERERVPAKGKGKGTSQK